MLFEGLITRKSGMDKWSGFHAPKSLSAIAFYQPPSPPSVKHEPSSSTFASGNNRQENNQVMDCNGPRFKLEWNIEAN